MRWAAVRRVMLQRIACFRGRGAGMLHHARWNQRRSPGMSLASDSTIVMTAEAFWRTHLRLYPTVLDASCML